MEMYKRSSMGWSAAKKREEMLHPAMRYLVFREDEQVKGFTSFMVTEEEGVEVIYWFVFFPWMRGGGTDGDSYELQLAPEAQGKGYGEKLMMQLEGFGRNVGLRKAMLTVFTENTGAIRFYRRIGYVFVLREWVMLMDGWVGMRWTRFRRVRDGCGAGRSGSLRTTFSQNRSERGAIFCVGIHLNFFPSFTLFCLVHLLYLYNILPLHFRSFCFPLVSENSKKCVCHDDCNGQTPHQCDGIEEVGVARASIDP